MTDTELAAIRARAESATSGPLDDIHELLAHIEEQKREIEHLKKALSFLAEECGEPSFGGKIAVFGDEDTIEGEPIACATHPRHCWYDLALDSTKEPEE